MTATARDHLPDYDRPDRPPLPPVRFPYDPVTWKEIAHLLLNLPTAVFGFVFTVVLLLLGCGLSVTVIGLPLLTAGLLAARRLGAVERARARALLGVY
ncbi:sensor domain-containing protein, partial [Streptomyces chryseus]|uniref:sensor domain-containing protein n=1 Tax=Streptomyces chryseus TaxID=68186 RepID=UPI001B85DF1D